jgi:hypothetical protein
MFYRQFAPASRGSTRRADASGVEVVNDCQPTCVAGHAHRTKVTVTMSKPIRCPGHKYRVFDRLTVRFKGKTGAHSTHTVRLGCPV